MTRHFCRVTLSSPCRRARLREKPRRQFRVAAAPPALSEPRDARAHSPLSGRAGRLEPGGERFKQLARAAK